jgi:hypothetical protein
VKRKPGATPRRSYLRSGSRFFVVRTEDGHYSAVQQPPPESEIITAIEPVRRPDDVPGFGDEEDLAVSD